LRDFHADDLDQAISVWDQSRRPDESHPVFPVSEVVSAAKSGQPAVVAVVGDQLVGMAVAQQHGERAWISMVALSNRWRDRGIGSALLSDLEVRLRTLGVRRISALLAEDATGTAALRNSGYAERSDLLYFEKLDHVGASDAGLLAALGGQVMPRGLWQALAGMEAEKRVIERRIVLPLAEPNLAEQYGVSPPKAVILFGPPGTGKTSFAKAVAGRLGWPFVEVFPSRLAATDVAMTTALREAFVNLMELEAAVVFIDEVEEIAGSRSGIPSDPAHGGDQRATQAHPGVPPARRAVIDMRDELRAVAGFGLSASWPVRLHHSGRAARRCGPRRDLETVSGRHRRIGRGRQAGRSERDVHPRGYRVCGPKGRSIGV